MVSFNSKALLGLILMIVYLTCHVSCQNCTVNTRCLCLPKNNTDISCKYLPTLNNLTFSPSPVWYGRFLLYVPWLISVIPDMTFDGLYIRELYVVISQGITSIDCGAFSGLEESLSVLRLVTNRLSRVPACSLTLVPELKTLVLQNTQIRKVIQGDFSSVSKLESLSLTYSKLENLAKNCFENLTSLKDLYLQYNNIEDLDLSPFYSITQLQRLYFGNNGLRFLDLNIVYALPKLIYLDMSNNRISQLRPKDQRERVSAELASIYTILLKNNSVSTLEAGIFANLRKLTVIDLSDNYITELGKGVFRNAPSVQRLLLRNNKIRTIHPDAFEDIYPVLTQLDLFGNPLTKKSASDLFSIIPSFSRMYTLYLSDVPLPPISQAVMLLLKKSLYLQLRNCSIPDYPDFNINGTMRWRNVDLSGNMLSVFGTRVKPMTLASVVSTVIVNISHNMVQHVNVTVLRIYYLNFDAENNKIKDFTINVTSYATSRNVNSLTVNLRDNQINNKIQIIGPVKVVFLDLSKNRMKDITEFPLTIYSTNGSVQWDPCLSSSTTVNSLNLSGNAIEAIFASSCLGSVKILDLSHNQLKVFGNLTDGSLSKNMRLTTLYLNGNQLHQISADSFQRFEGILSRIDLRSNQLKTLPNMVNLVSNRSFVQLYLENNPLNCNCDLDWLRDPSISVTKIVGARCAEPIKSRAYLLICVELDSCGPDELPLFPPLSGVSICRGDSFVEITDLTSMYSTENRTLTVTWSTYGPGTIVEFQVVYRDANNEDGGKIKTVSPGRGFNSVLLSDLDTGHSYQICVTAIVRPNILFGTSCVDAIAGCCPETKPVPVETVPVVTIALGVALGICVMAIIVLTVCIVKCRSSASTKTKHKTLNELYLRSSQTRNESGNDYTEGTPEETYDDIRESQIYLN